MTSKKRLNILIFKFALALGGGEKFSLLISKKFNASGARVKFYTNLKSLYKQFTKEGINASRIYWGHEAGARRYLIEYYFLWPINIIRFFFILAFNKKRKSFNIVLFQNLNEKIFASSVAKFLGYKVFWVEHLSIDPWLVKNILRKKYLKKSHKINKIIAVSELVKKELIDFGVNPEKIEVIYNSVDLNEFKILDHNTVENEKKKLGFFKGSKIIGYVGRLHHEKGLDVLIDSFHGLLKRFDHLYLLIVGDGEERGNLEEKIREMGLEKRILFLGYKENIPLFLNMIDVLVLPSKIREAFGMVLVEAMACGKVAIGSRLGGIPEIIKNEVNGFLFEPGSEKELTDKLSRSLSDEKLRKKIILNGFEDVEKRFSLDTNIKKMEDIFKK